MKNGEQTQNRMPKNISTFKPADRRDVARPGRKWEDSI
jgi:hypothetical protein